MAEHDDDPHLPQRLRHALNAAGPAKAVIVGAAAGLLAAVAVLVIIAAGDDGRDRLTADTSPKASTEPAPNTSTAVVDPDEVIASIPGTTDDPLPTLAPDEPERPADDGTTPGVTPRPTDPLTSTGAWRPPGSFLASSHDGSMVITNDSIASTTTVFNTATHRQVVGLREAYSAAWFSADSSFVMLADINYTLANAYRVDVVALPSGVLTGSLSLPATASPPLHSLASDAFIYPGRTLELRRRDGTLVRTIDPGFYPLYSLLSDDGTTLAVKSTGKVAIYDIATGSLRVTISTRCADIARLKLSSTGKRVVVDENCGSPTVRTYDTATGTLVAEITDANAGGGTLALTPDDSRLVVAPASLDQPISVVDQAGQPRNVLTPSSELLSAISRLSATGGVRSAVISADGRRIGVVYVLYHGSGGYEVSTFTAVHDLASGQQLGEFYPDFEITAFGPNDVLVGRTNPNVAVVYEF